MRPAQLLTPLLFGALAAAWMAFPISTRAGERSVDAGAASRVRRADGPPSPEAVPSADFRSAFLRAEASGARGAWRQALRDFSIALEIAEQAGDPARIAMASGGAGHAYLASRAYAPARANLERSIALARKSGRRDIEAVSLNGLGNLMAAQGDQAAALAAHQNSAALAKAGNNRSLAARALANAARTAGARGDAVLARRMFDEAHEHALEIGRAGERAYVLAALGRLAQTQALAGADRANGTARARAILAQAAELAGSAGDGRTRSFALGYLGELHEGIGSLDQARRFTAEALFVAKEAQAPELEYRWHWQNARLLRASGDRDGAIEALRRSIAALRPLQLDIQAMDGTEAASFKSRIKPVFDDLVVLLLERAGSGSGPEAAARDLVEARDTVERLKTAELQDYFRDECVVSARPAVQPLDQIAPHAAVVYPIFLADRVELLLSSKQGISHATSKVPLDELVAEIVGLREALRDLAGRHYLAHARRLYEWLVRPLEPGLRSIRADTLVFVPDGPLRTIPLAALHDGEDFLIRRYAFATSPGMTLTDVRPFRAGGKQALMAGLTKSVQGFPALPKVGAELDAIGKLYQGRRLQDETFVVSNFEQAMDERPYGVVHIATHARFERDARNSFVLTHDGKLSLAQLENLLGSREASIQPLELLSLSACQTALGDERAALGLAGVSVKAGARSALATLWEISDTAAAALLPEFYRQLADPDVSSKAEALRNAQLKLMTDDRFAHPGFWSPFLLIGNWL